jgi:multiple sugar transport system permease protein
MEETIKPTSRSRRTPLWSFESPWLWLAPAILLLVVYSIYPLIFNIFTSFQEFSPVSHNFEWVGLKNWIYIFQDERTLNALKNTFSYMFIALTVELVLGMSIALLFDSKIYLKGLWQTLIILPMVTPPAVAGLIFRLLEHSDFGVLSWVLYGAGIIQRSEPLLGGTGKWALTAVLLADIWQWTPFVILIFLAGLKSLPSEPLEAAEVDGASGWQKFWLVKLPLMRNVVAIVILFRVIDLYRLFDYVYIMTMGGPGNRTETISFYAYRTYSFVEWGHTAVLAIVVLALIWVSTNLYIRFFHVEW